MSDPQANAPSGTPAEVEEARHQLDQQIATVAATTPYPPDAFRFVLQTLYILRDWHPGRTHFTAAELCEALIDMALGTFRSRAREQLHVWSIDSCEDIGQIVYAMVDVGLIRARPEDRPEEFLELWDFDTAFARYGLPARLASWFRWRLSTQLFITAVVVLAAAGFAFRGMMGAISVLIGTWFVSIGVVCLYEAAKGVSRRAYLRPIFAVMVGMLFAGMGAGLFMIALISSR